MKKLMVSLSALMMVMSVSVWAADGIVAEKSQKVQMGDSALVSVASTTKAATTKVKPKEKMRGDGCPNGYWNHSGKCDPFAYGTAK